MKLSLILIAASAMALAVPLPGSAPAFAASSCESALDVGCDMPAGAFLHPDAEKHTVAHTADTHAVVTHHMLPASAPPASAVSHRAANPCDDIAGGGSGIPAYLYSQCK